MDKARLPETQIMCGQCKPDDIEEIGHIDVLDRENARDAKFPTSALLNRTGVLNSYEKINSKQYI
jgi:hypothetical protein